ncbi:MAG: hypothetical protein A3G18_10540 [Rhodospirillales bacterium RIFCSPLOWO2_12_FULL_58_28]|nr:MAG: hypothetical protein A3H92_10900 [Rhodospirillales bacterium RIFCSPLOWO2_02_FULL_58_16]OHC77861.1 MAG: hypothetical protein A3G18_10540 [Rhodospirillales bacterium RIFCSPLOWO2_12_FULL_58_28]
MRISEFIDSTNAAKSAEEVFHLYEKAVAYYGFDRIMYSALTRHPAHDSISTPSIMRNYPDDWINHYVEKGYIQTDPVRKYGIATRGPFTWEGMEEKLQLSPAQKDVMNGGREAGLHNGIGVPLHGPFGEVVGVGLASSTGGVDPKEHLSAIHLLTVQFHTVYMAHLEIEKRARPPVRLTPREREVLQWCKEGKSNWAIGEILHISEHGVDFHLRNILSKLNAESRITAVVKALYFGLITI